jgi:O-antigen ligase
VAAETGIAGLALYVWLLAVALVAAFQRAGPSFLGRVQLVCAIALSAITVHSLFYASFFEDPMVWGFLAIVVGTSTGLARETSVA